MKDRVPLYPGRVKLTTVSGQENTFDMVRADDPTQEGDPINKNTLFKDATAALFGLDENAVPDDALALLSRFHSGMGNEYIWEKYIKEYTPLFTLSGFGDGKGNITVGGMNDFIAQYSDTIDIKTGQLTGTIKIINMPHQSMYPNEKVAPLKGKYWKDSKGTNVYYTKENASLTTGDNGSVTIADTSKYFGYSTTKTDISYLNSYNKNAYPPAVSDGYTYTALGQLGGKAQIATGSYTGTGTYGESNPNSLTFEFEPQFIFIQCMGDNEIGCFYPSAMSNAYVTGAGIVVDGNSNYTLYTKMAGTTLSWYGTNNQEGQLNRNKAYRYLAIG